MHFQLLLFFYEIEFSNFLEITKQKRDLVSSYGKPFPFCFEGDRIFTEPLLFLYYCQCLRPRGVKNALSITFICKIQCVGINKGKTILEGDA